MSDAVASMKKDPRYKVTRVVRGKKAQDLYIKFFKDARSAWKRFPFPTFVYYSYRGKKAVSYYSGKSGHKTGLSRTLWLNVSPFSKKQKLSY
jgi:hypothetical protein